MTAPFRRIFSEKPLSQARGFVSHLNAYFSIKMDGNIRNFFRGNVINVHQAQAPPPAPPAPVLAAREAEPVVPALDGAQPGAVPVQNPQQNPRIVPQNNAEGRGGRALAEGVYSPLSPFPSPTIPDVFSPSLSPRSASDIIRRFPIPKLI